MTGDAYEGIDVSSVLRDLVARAVASLPGDAIDIYVGGGMGSPGIDAMFGGVTWSVSSNRNWDIDLDGPEKWVLVGYAVERDCLYDAEQEIANDGPAWGEPIEVVAAWVATQLKVISSIDWSSRPPTYRT